MNTDELIQENRHLKDQLATLSKTHAKDMQRLSDMIDAKDRSMRKLCQAANEYLTEIEDYTRRSEKLRAIIQHNADVDARRDETPTQYDG